MRANVDAKQADAKTRKETAEKAAAAQTLADEEKTAVEAFPDQSKQIAAKINKAQSLAWQAKWEDADETLSAAQGMLDDFKETSVEQSIDRDGNRALIRAAKEAGVKHFVLLSVQGAAPDREVRRQQELRASAAFLETWLMVIGGLRRAPALAVSA